MEIKARAEIIFYVDRFEKPEVRLTGDWSAREVNRVEALVTREFRRRIREIQKAGVMAAPSSGETPIEEEEEVSDGS